MNGDTVEIGTLTILRCSTCSRTEANILHTGIVGPPADDLLGYEGVEGAQGPRFRKLSPQEIEDYLTNL